MAYLFNKGEIGANAYVIQHRANIPLQEYKRFRGFLEDLCKKSFLNKYEEETGGTKARTIHKITENGKKIVETCRLHYMQNLFGSIEDLFDNPPPQTESFITTVEYTKRFGMSNKCRFQRRFISFFYSYIQAKFNNGCNIKEGIATLELKFGNKRSKGCSYYW
jgi:hypothetical protein